TRIRHVPDIQWECACSFFSREMARLCSLHHQNQNGAAYSTIHESIQHTSSVRSILNPAEHEEPLYHRHTARLSLLTHRAVEISETSGITIRITLMNFASW